MRIFETISFKKVTILLCSIFLYALTYGQTVSFNSSDSSLNNAFKWAKNTALSYKGNPNDPVGPWYEASLPGRNAFCIRDVCHMCTGAEILGLHAENKNMITRFVSNISASKNWCSYWEINKWGKPAPVDYKNDEAFWYNLNANFELIYASWRLYQWTADTTYIANPIFTRFFNKSLNEYIGEWKLNIDSLFARQPIPNRPKSLHKNDDYYFSRGLPSYVESMPNIKISADLIAAIYQGFSSYSSILKKTGYPGKSRYYLQRSLAYKSFLNNRFWDNSTKSFHAFYLEDGTFVDDNSDGIFLLWFRLVNDTTKTASVIRHLVQSKLNVETTSYLPYLLCLNHHENLACKYILYLSSPATKRRTYPEVSYGVIEGIIQGLMGIEPHAPAKEISTLYRGAGIKMLSVKNLPVLNTSINVKHDGKQKTTFQNSGTATVHWKALFAGNYLTIIVNNKIVKAKHSKDLYGNIYSYIIVSVLPHQKACAKTIDK